MQGLKRSARSFGAVLRHRAGIGGMELLNYAQARRLIYLPAHSWVLERRLQAELDELRRLGATQTVVLLDYETNDDLDDLSCPLAHAGLVARYLEDSWPAIEE